MKITEINRFNPRARGSMREVEPGENKAGTDEAGTKTPGSNREQEGV
ncbi:hypothetical protein QA612_03925 [Evansella sp. AB-P1]|nr:hypothetical protein [Evansella sp. AB-P1]MDG5786627.1 hypothetical protein [Evansella sp. AB-P1]